MKSLKYILITFIVAITFTSCNGWLDVQPEDGVVRERYWKTKEEVRAAVLGCYSQMLDLKMMEFYFTWGEMRAEMVLPGSSANSNLRAINSGEITADNVYTNWAPFYTAINQCNTVIELAPLALEHDESFSEQQLKEYIAEVTCIRSLMYFYLVRTFRDVPYYEMAYIYDYQNFALPKTDGKIIIDNLIASLEAIENDIPAKYDMTDAARYENSDPNKGRFNYYGWASLLADICLWKGEYDKCISLADRIINSGQYSLVPVSREELLSYNIETGVNDTVFEAVQGDVTAMFMSMYGNGNSIESIFELQNPPSYNNPYVSMFSGIAPSNISVEANIANFSNEYFIASNIDRVWRDIRTEGFSYGAKYVWKWAGLDNAQWRNTSSSTSNWIFYRLADIILMKAEALIEQSMADNNQEKLQQALGLIRQIRTRANAPESTDMFYKNDAQLDARTMEEFVLAERCRELTFEGKRWFDLVRVAQRDNYSERTMSYLIRMVVLAAPPEKTTIIQNKWQANKGSLYMPINAGELNRNNNLIQNDFYAK